MFWGVLGEEDKLWYFNTSFEFATFDFCSVLASQVYNGEEVASHSYFILRFSLGSSFLGMI